MGGYWHAPDDYADQWISGQGYAGYVSEQKTPAELAEIVRQIATEVSGKDFSVPKNKLGFY
jgi:hypothetical protein